MNVPLVLVILLCVAGALSTVRERDQILIEWRGFAFWLGVSALVFAVWCWGGA
ncbi:MAG TPA: hypothetical protein VFJ01_05540 [Oleiagrimonas sp.]|nr:hypothetical protein [Oleiagrimonas sp.]